MGKVKIKQTKKVLKNNLVELKIGFFLLHFIKKKSNTCLLYIQNF